MQHTPPLTREFLEFAHTRGLLVSGGSDCHGTIRREPEMGKVRLPYHYFEAIKAALGEKDALGRS